MLKVQVRLSAFVGGASSNLVRSLSLVKSNFEKRSLIYKEKGLTPRNFKQPSSFLKSEDIPMWSKLTSSFWSLYALAGNFHTRSLYPLERNDLTESLSTFLLISGARLLVLEESPSIINLMFLITLIS